LARRYLGEGGEAVVNEAAQQKAGTLRVASRVPAWTFQVTLQNYGRGGIVGRGLGVGVCLGEGVEVAVAVALGVADAAAVAVAVAVAVALAVAVGVGLPAGNWNLPTRVAQFKLLLVT
jgi:hypothetical protein